MFLPALEELDENVADPEVIDLGAREALKLKNPPCALMDRLGRDEVERIIAPALERFGIVKPAALARVGRLTA
jgi:3-hydroxyacyl-CoA dehydrogenase